MRWTTRHMENGAAINILNFIDEIEEEKKENTANKNTIDSSNEKF